MGGVNDDSNAAGRADCGPRLGRVCGGFVAGLWRVCGNLNEVEIEKGGLEIVAIN